MHSSILAHVLDRCEVSVMIPFDPTEPGSGSIIGSEPDTGIEIMVHCWHFVATE
jgi:hypothetical protein